jgi:3-oxoacyl-[acyl-carrier protein] reductase
MKGLKDKVAIITGAGSPRGIGYATAIRFADEGVHVAVTDLAANESLLKEATAAVEARGVKSLPITTDVTDEGQIQSCVNQVVRSFGGVDILFNNAGIGQVQLFEETDLDVWDWNYRVNVRGVVAFMKAVIPVMKQRGSGVIVNNASIGGLYADAEYSAYNASKFAVVGLSKSVALELGPYKIRVNAVCPGLVDTEMGDKMPIYFSAKEGCTSEEVRKNMAQQVALKTWARPDQIADAVAFLASDDSSHITGITLPVTGGFPVCL